jgi:hypothetical protein
MRIWSAGAWRDMSELNLQEAMPAANTALRRALGADKPDPHSPAIVDPRAWASPLPAWCSVGLGAVCVIMLLWAASIGASHCHAPPMPLALGTESHVSIALRANTACTIRVSAANVALGDVVVGMPPRHGTLAPRGRTGATYRPAPGFKGDDSFAFAIRARSSSDADMSVIRVRASVR